MINSATGVVGNLLGGYLFDRIGGYRSILFGIVVSIFALILLTIWHGWPMYIWFVALLGFSGGIIFPSMYATMGSIWPEGGRKAFNAIYLAQNLGVAIGPAIAGIVAARNINYIFLANLLAYLLFFIIVVIFYRKISGFSRSPNFYSIRTKESETKSSLLCDDYCVIWLYVDLDCLYSVDFYNFYLYVGLGNHFKTI